jgi:hypothetical protein
MDKFLENMESYGLGYVTARMSQLQDKIVEAVQETGLNGKITLDLTFKRKGASGIVVAAKLSPKVPEAPIQSVEMFVDENFKLHEENPSQMNYDNVSQIKPKKVNSL